MTQLGQMYAWASPDYLLEKMSLEQWIHYYRLGWESKQTEMKVNWGILGTLLNGGEDSKEDSPDLSLDEVQRYYPGAYLKDGKVILPE